MEICLKEAKKFFINWCEKMFSRLKKELSGSIGWVWAHRHQEIGFADSGIN